MILNSALAAIVLAKTASSKAFEFCEDGKCTDCPVSLTDAGTGYPNCVIYESKRVFANQDFPDAKGGGFAPYLNIEPPDETCAIIVRSPANTDEVNCGIPIGSFKHPTCVELSLKETFMVQFCCGHYDCEDAGANGKRSARFSPNYPGLLGRGGGGGGVYLQRHDGTIIEPLEIGKSKSLAEIQARDKPNICGNLNTPEESDTGDDDGEGRCDGDWDGTDIYTKPSEKTQIIANNIASSATCTITVSQSWTNGTDFSLGIADVLSLGATFHKSFTKGYTKSITQTIDVPEGQSGDWGWTAFMECTKGSGTCDGQKVSGEICWPKVDGSGPVGANHLIQHGV